VTVEVEIGSRTHRVELQRQGPRWVATLDGRAIAVDAAPLGDGWSLLIDEAGPTGPASRTIQERCRRALDVTLDRRKPGEWVVYVSGEVIHVRLADPRAWRRDRRRRSGSAGGSRTVTSAMAGRVVKVLVEPGDRVTERQPLVVVEAMKMENELRAPGDAVVREVNVAEGASVEAGAILLVLE
jgi:pyruvate carboxylase subunit B